MSWLIPTHSHTMKSFFISIVGMNFSNNKYVMIMINCVIFNVFFIYLRSNDGIMEFNFNFFFVFVCVELMLQTIEYGNSEWIDNVSIFSVFYFFGRKKQNSYIIILHQWHSSRGVNLFGAFYFMTANPRWEMIGLKHEHLIHILLNL